MAMTINPAVRRISYRRWGAHVILFTIGVAGGAALTYAAARGIFTALHPSVPIVLAAAAAVAVGLCVLRDLGLPSVVPYPRRRQVPEWLRRTLPGGPTALLYGAQLGTGFLTRYTYATHLAFVVLLASEGVGAPVIAGIAVFSVCKTITVVAGFGGRTYSEYEQRLSHRHRRRGQDALRRFNGVVALGALAIFIVNL